MKENMMKIHNSGWKRRVSLVLIFTMLLSVFMYQGWFAPERAEAAVSALQQFPASPQLTATTGNPSGTFTISAGSNRLLVVAVGVVDAAVTGHTYAATYGGMPLTEVAIYNAQRRGTWIGILKETDIAARSGDTLTVAITGTHTDARVYIASYQGVDQTTPATGTSFYVNNVQSGALGSLTAGANDNGYRAYIWAGTTAVTRTSDSETFTEHSDLTTQGTILTLGMASKAIGAGLASNPTVTWSATGRIATASIMVNAASLCTDSDIATLTTTNPTNSSTVGGTVTIQTQVGTEATPSGMTGMVVNITGSTGCNVTNGVMTWNGTSSRWEYSWDTSACGTGTPDTGVSITASGTDPDCSTAVSAPAISNVTIDNACSDPDAAVLTVTNPASASTISGTITVQMSVATETAPQNMTTVEFQINGTWRAATWNSGNSRWEYSWNSKADYPGTGTPIAATINAHGTDIDCNSVKTASVSFNVNNPVTISCSSCHTNYPNLGDYASGRNASTGQFKGSHDKHTGSGSGKYGYVCTNCHADNGSATNHRNGNIEMSSVTYTRGSSIAQTNTSGPYGGCQNTYCHSSGISATTPPGSIPSNNSLIWGTSNTACNVCHGVGTSDGRPNYNTGKANAHTKTTHAAQTCDVCHDSVTYSGGVYTPNTSHVNQAYSIQAALGYTAGTAAAGGTCASPGCHSSVSWGGSLTCLDCHSQTVTRTQAAGTLDNVVGEMQTAAGWGHARNNGFVATVAMCIVCHLEGDSTTQKTSAKHGDGNIDLRDPDGGSTEAAVTNISGGAFTFTKFSMNFTSRANALSDSNIADVISNKFCLKCHDSNGATNTGARVGGAATSQYKPFNTTIAGAGYVTPLSAGVTGGVFDVARNFATTNSSYHPVRGSLSRDFPAQSLLKAPYNNNGGRTGVSGTKTPSVVINCFDCHNTPTTQLTTRTVAAHGSTAANHLRGSIYSSVTTSPILCMECHADTYRTNTGFHPSGSAFASAARTHTSYFTLCNNCHLSKTTTAPARPIPGEDIHGFNRLLDSGGTDALWPTGATESWRPYGFMRNTVNFNLTTAGPKPYAASDVTTGLANCGNGRAACSSYNMSGYTPGGSY
jgi:predicted CxxxxCH...CXXCH cytochrome family protein